MRYYFGRARILTLCQDLWAKGQSQVDSFYRVSWKDRRLMDKSYSRGNMLIFHKSSHQWEGVEALKGPFSSTRGLGRMHLWRTNYCAHKLPVAQLRLQQVLCPYGNQVTKVENSREGHNETSCLPLR
ncbi:hypothetical protein SLEP1_g3661 [Rubroshorea leprosula]|uniref:Uncharacterized protein n=1 Tax=Rubroshorea leprosula TaxID=152421 RepID=A0AAV5HRW6_9ROSI|nr:hypothetical protein SLEP1_g3661 [Rubroshorea leprosula]